MLLKIAWSHYHRYSKNNPSFHWSNRAHAHSHLTSCTRFAEEMECMIWATQNKYLRIRSMIFPNLAKLSSLICSHQTFSMQLRSLGTFFDFITSRPMKHRLPMYLSDWTSEIHQPEQFTENQENHYIEFRFGGNFTWIHNRTMCIYVYMCKYD